MSQEAQPERESDLEAQRELAEVALGAAERLTFFSDAVVAIAVTLLALNLPVPKGDTAAAVLNDLHAHRGAYLAFVISFLVVAGYWTSHHAVFRYLRRMDSTLLRLNLLWLFMLILMPWLANLLAGDESDSEQHSGEALRFAMYAGGQVVVNVLFALMLWIIHAHRLDHGYLPAEVYGSSLGRTASVTTGFVLSIPLFFLWLNAWILWIVVPMVVGFTLRRVRRARQRRTAFS